MSSSTADLDQCANFGAANKIVYAHCSSTYPLLPIRLLISNRPMILVSAEVAFHRLKYF